VDHFETCSTARAVWTSLVRVTFTNFYSFCA
jgi:hypothetical protein